MTCERLFQRSGRRCTRPAAFTLHVEVTDEEVHLCQDCTHLYEQGVPISFAPKGDKPWMYPWGQWIKTR